MQDTLANRNFVMPLLHDRHWQAAPNPTCLPEEVFQIRFTHEVMAEYEYSDILKYVESIL